MPRPYTEDQLVEQPAIGLFADLGWQTVSAMEELKRRLSPNYCFRLALNLILAAGGGPL
jgi:hypothetical protein